MGDITNNLIDTIKELARRIRSLELSVFTYGEQPDSPPSEAAIAGLTSSVAYYTEPITLLPRATATFNWTKPNTPDDPVVSYYVSVTRTGDAGTGGFVNAGDVNSYVVSGLPVDTNVTFRIYGVTRAGVVGPTASHTRTITRQTAAPLQPATPGVEGALRGIRVSNNGLSSTGGAMPADLAYYEVHAVNNGTTTFTPTATTLWGKMGSNESVYITANASYQNIAVRLVAVNTTGVKSTPSTGVIGTPLKVNDTDSGITLPTGSAYSDVNNLIKDGSFESPVFRDLRTTNASYQYNNAAGAAKHGTWALKHTNTINPGTNRVYNVTNSTIDDTALSEFIVTSGTKYYIGLQARNIGSDGTVVVFLRFRLNNDTFIYQGLTLYSANLTTGDWELAQNIITAPDTAVSAMVYISVRDTNTVGEWHFDSLEVRQVMGTVLIEDGAITNAKIGDASITTAKIEELDAGVIKSGVFSSDRIGAQTIATRHLRVGAVTQSELDPTIGEGIDIGANPALSDMASASVVGGIADTVQNLANDITTLNNVVDISASGVTISQDGSPFSINLNNSELGFYEGGARVAYVNGQKLYVRSAEFAEQVKIGVHIIEKYDENNTFIRWVG